MQTIRTRPHTYFAGHSTNGHQVLLGWVLDFVAVITFDESGPIQNVSRVPLDIDFSTGLGPAIEGKVELVIKSIMEQMDFRDGPIKVEPFFVDEWQIGIRPFPLDLQEFLEGVTKVTEEDAEIFREDVDRWRKAGNCVLWWGNDYHLDHEGFTL